MSKSIDSTVKTSIADHPDPDWRPPEPPEALARLRNERRLNLPDDDLWVFGYGSIMWRPGFPYLERREARLMGFHRRYCVFSYFHRGSPKQPGLVFGLDHGGACRGAVYRVARQEGEAVMEFLYDREMVTAVYVPRWVTVETDQGRLRAATFTVDRSHEQYAGHLSEDEALRVILQGQGANGSSRDYLASMIHHLKEAGIRDRALERLLARVRMEAI